MRVPAPLSARLAFLARVTRKECQHLLETDARLFGDLFTVQVAQKIETDPILAERLDAFVGRFGRLQDTVGDKLLPAVLSALAETPGPVIENLDKAERFGFIASADGWLEIRKLRNQMVHEYIEDLTVLASALRAGHGFVPVLVAAASRLADEADRVVNAS